MIDLYIRSTAFFRADKSDLDNQLKDLGINTEPSEEDDKPVVGRIAFFASSVEFINESNKGTAVIHFKSGNHMVSTVKYDELDDVLRDWNTNKHKDKLNEEGD